MDEFVVLVDVANRYKLPERMVYDILLKRGNKLGIKIIASEFGGKTYISRESYSEIISVADELIGFVWDIDNILKIAEDKIPFTPAPTVYFLIEGREIMYIGQSVNLVLRIGKHVTDKVFSLISILEVSHNDLTITEDMNIYCHSPKYNKNMFNNEQYFREIVKRCIFN